VHAFKGSAPNNLSDPLHQVLRWALGSIETRYRPYLRDQELKANDDVRLLSNYDSQKDIVYSNAPKPIKDNDSYDKRLILQVFKHSTLPNQGDNAKQKTPSTLVDYISSVQFHPWRSWEV
jgi:hypothetical protein